MAVRDKELLGLTGWPRGVNNIAREEQLADGIPDKQGANAGELRVGENIDLDEAGKPTTRPGRTLAKALPGLHSIWADPRFPLMLGVYDGDMIAFDSTLAHQVAVALADPKQPLSVDVGAGYAYWSNGFQTGRVSPTGEHGEWAAEQPIGEPELSIEAAGGLRVGNYAVAITYLDADGRESGSSLAVDIDLEEGQGIRLSGIPQPTRADTAAVRVYCSFPGGDGLRFVRDLPVGLTTFLIGVHQPGRLLETMFLEPLPAGQVVGFHMGRQFVIRGKVVFWSEALIYGLSNLASSYFKLPTEGSLLASLGENEVTGLFVGTRANGAAEGSTYFMSGAAPPWRRTRCYPHGAVPGSMTMVEAELLELEGVVGRVPYWLADSGQLVAGVPGGRVIELHRDRYVANERAERASTAVREYRGMRSLVTAARGGTVSRFAVSDRASAERWRDGVRID